MNENECMKARRSNTERFKSRRLMFEFLKSVTFLTIELIIIWEYFDYMQSFDSILLLNLLGPRMIVICAVCEILLIGNTFLFIF